MWHDGRIYFTEMGADRVTIIENGGTREFWHMPGCGPTQIVPFGPTGFVVDCHLGRAMVEVSAAGVTGRTLHHQPRRPAAAGSQRRGERRAGRGVFLRRRHVRPQRAFDRPRLSPQRHGRDDRGGRPDPIRQRRQLRSGEPHALCVRASGAARAGAHPRPQPARHRAKGADRFRASRTRPGSSAIRWPAPTASRCGPACWRSPNTARGGCTSSTATAGTRTRSRCRCRSSIR